MKKVLIANRGEIAVRIVRACADYGVRSVAVHADADIDAPHARMADEAYGLAGTRPAETYLDAAKLLAVAARCGADAVHPGYGFLSESAGFARAVIGAGLTWIGPPPSVIERLGDKVQARRLAREVGAPLVAGTPGLVESADEVMAFAREHGLPIAIKAAFGGGGRGLKVVWQWGDIAAMYDSAVREALAAFGRDECYVEQFLDQPRHLEAQVIADRHGRVVVLGTRDCSLQRRNQKLVEEAPAPYLPDDLRAQIVGAAQAICAHVGYESAGTVEFLLSRSGTLSFLEVNTRLQVEHTVTEETCGLDLVVEQLRIADGLPLTLTETPAPRGHAIEFRINAEDVGRGFLPTPGRILTFDVPAGPGVRVDSGVARGGAVTGGFDSLMAKLVISGATREQALARARRALAEFRIEGVASVLPFHRAVVDDPAFIGHDGFKVHTRWIETEFVLPGDVGAGPRAEPLAAAELRRTVVEIDGRRTTLAFPTDFFAGFAAATAPAEPAEPSAAVGADAAAVRAPMAGTLMSWAVEEGADVTSGQRLGVIEAMKMEVHVCAHRAGRVSDLRALGSSVDADQVIARVEGARDAGGVERPEASTPAASAPDQAAPV